MELRPCTPEELDALAGVIWAWLSEQLRDNPAVAAVEQSVDDDHRWFVRLNGDEKSVFSVWFWLRQRTLHVETYVLPAPLERAAELYEFLLRRNTRLNGLAFAIGLEDAVYLVGQVPNTSVTPSELDRLLGSVYEYTESVFRPAMRLGFGDRFTG